MTHPHPDPQGSPDPRRRSRMLGVAMFHLCALGVTLYFGHAAVQGENGYLEKLRLEARADDLRAELRALGAERARMETLARGLTPGTVDLDLLDERARAVLGLIREDEILIR